MAGIRKGQNRLPPSLLSLFSCVAGDSVTFQDVLVVAAKDIVLGAAKVLRARRGERGHEKPEKQAGDRGSREGGSAEL